MLRMFRLIFLALLAIALVAVASANRDTVTLRLLPQELDAYLGFGWSAELPLFLVIFAGIVAGLGIGFVWEWFREAKHRAAASQHKREAGRLEREVSRLKAAKPEPEDEVLAILEGKGAAR
ncbi:LapA family protein [Defluviimonas sp. WL0024]|uniref:LapA family protein n=2 Tax=Albidovulum salinarum TaxID=2984153 RepID=A0ABT2X4N3_9RHOB|nr:LapA family protein [Defluviimonas sp. WL0024]